VTGQRQYADAAEKVIERMDAIKPADGLFPIFISPDSGSPTTSQVTFGALGDSFYEYLIKVWVQGGQEESRYRRMYDDAMRGMTSKLLKRSNPSGLTYVADWNGATTQDKMDHLVCFVPGMLALGAFYSKGTPGESFAARDLLNAKAIMYTCWQMYERQATGIASEYVDFPSGNDLQVPSGAPFYILRPEAAESLFIMHQLTGNPIYREWGWRMFQAIDRYCRCVQQGASGGRVLSLPLHRAGRSLGTVRTRTCVTRPDNPTTVWRGEGMRCCCIPRRAIALTPLCHALSPRSFFLAETLKYLYLLQSPDHPISLEQRVFNTEAHPLRTFAMLKKAGLLKR